MQNLDKPNAGVPETYLNIGSGFNLLVGGTFRLIIGALGLGGMTNIAKASIGTTWGTWTTPWKDETRTWAELSQLLTNVSINANIWESRTLPWTVATPWQLTGNGIINFDKP